MPCEKCCRLRKRLKDAQEREALLAKGLDNLRDEVRRLSGEKSHYKEKGRKRQYGQRKKKDLERQPVVEVKSEVPQAKNTTVRKERKTRPVETEKVVDDGTWPPPGLKKGKGSSWGRWHRMRQAYEEEASRKKR